jgi:hypothetical protein
VCAVMVVSVGLGTQGLFLARRRAVKTELLLLQTTCRYLQQVAIATNQEQQLVFDCALQKYSYDTSTHQLNAGVVYGFPQDLKGPPACPCKLLSKPVTFVNDTITFYPTGIISAGSVYFSDAGHTCCYALSNAISQVSYIRIYTSCAQKWQEVGV